MKKMIFAAALAAAALAAGGANADTFSPVSTTKTFTGTVSVEQNIKLTGCGLSATVNTNAAGNGAWVSAMSLSGGLCGLVGFSNYNWPVTVAAPTTPGAVATKLLISNINVAALSDGCAGSSLVDWDQSGTLSKITFSDPQSNIAPIAPATKPCKIVGVATQTSAPKITITK